MDTRTSRRYFTPADAQKMLPLIRKIVEDILEKGTEYRAAAESRTEDEARRELKGLSGEIVSLVNELEGLGCFYKDWNFDTGLVDFPALIDGEPVFLCWRSDEEDVEWYHGMDEGFAGRRPIPSAMLGEDGQADGI